MKTKKKVSHELPILNEMEEEILEQRLRERIIQSYYNHQDIKNRRISIWKYAAMWTGFFLIAGLSIWKNLPSYNNHMESSAKVISTTTKIKKITLSDSTTVLLYPHSTLTLMEHYNISDRKVSLIGNASFEVKKNKSKPFVVQSKHLQTTVLGTRFSVNSPINKNEHSVFLEEGKVTVKIDKRIDDHILAPHERMIYQENTKQWKVVKEDNVHLNMQRGDLTLDGVDLKTLNYYLSNYYQIQIVDQKSTDPLTNYKITLTPQMSIADIAELISVISMRKTVVKAQTIIIK